jgi:hypothetical protein
MITMACKKDGRHDVFSNNREKCLNGKLNKVRKGKTWHRQEKSWRHSQTEKNLKLPNV